MSIDQRIPALNQRLPAFILGLSIMASAAILGSLAGKAAVNYRQLERTVTVKGLSEREYPADIVIWPIQFNVAGNDLEQVYLDLEANSDRITRFLTQGGISAEEITPGNPSMTDKSAQAYGNNTRSEYRYTATQTVTVYSEQIADVRRVMTRLSDLGKQGIVLTGGGYQSQTEYLFTRLNEIKPEMVEEATRNAREVAEKFALDSGSDLGRIRTASQGQFSISSRDRNNPHIKKVRVVSTVEYYLSD